MLPSFLTCSGVGESLNMIMDGPLTEYKVPYIESISAEIVETGEGGE
jgi:hypothetical protein